jgi:hypothetical protein
VAGTVASPDTNSAASFTQDDIPRSGSPGQRVLVRGGVVLTMDRQLGDFERADVLIEGSKIAAVGPGIAPATAAVIDASRMIVMPGFVDSHRHMWQAQLRNILPNGRIDSDYPRDISGTARTVYRPEDVRLGNLLTAWGAVNAGVTTVLDWSHISNSPEHADAAVRGLTETGIRAVYAYGPGGRGSRSAHPRDIHRLRKTYFGSDDQLLTLALATGDDPTAWAVARDVGGGAQHGYEQRRHCFHRRRGKEMEGPARGSADGSAPARGRGVARVSPRPCRLAAHRTGRVFAGSLTATLNTRKRVPCWTRRARRSTGLALAVVPTGTPP